MSDYFKSIFNRVFLVGVVLFLFFELRSLSGDFFSTGKFLVYFATVGLIVFFTNTTAIRKWKEPLLDELLGKKEYYYGAPFVLGILNGFLTACTLLVMAFLESLFVSNFSIISLLTIESLIVIFKISLFIAVVMYVFYALYLANSKQKRLLDQQKVLTGNVSAQFESLKNQLDPHFLFNSLNVLNALIDENPEKAQDFTNSLSKIYRYILDQKNKELVLLEEELRFAKSYMELLHMRYEDGLTYSFPETIILKEGKVVPLSLQLLLENVIKHNKVSGLKPIHISIKEEDGYLCIQNNLNRKTNHDDRKGIGLENIANRYAILTNRQVILTVTEDYFTIKIPILIKKTFEMELLDNNEEMVLIKAKKKVEELKKFYGHLTTYLAVNLFLMMINLLTAPEFLWFLIPLFAWGIAILSQGMKVYDYHLFLGKNWEDRKMQEWIEKEKRKTEKWN